MATVRLRPREAFVGDDVRIVFNVKDVFGAGLDITAAIATLRIAQESGDAHIIEKTVGNGLTAAATQLIAKFNTSEIVVAEAQVTGQVEVQLRLTINSVSRVAAILPLTILPSIS